MNKDTNMMDKSMVETIFSTNRFEKIVYPYKKNQKQPPILTHSSYQLKKLTLSGP